MGSPPIVNLKNRWGGYSNLSIYWLIY